MRKYEVRSAITKCSICGKRVCNAFFDKESPIYLQMVEKNCCYDCAYWEDLIANPPENMEVVNQTLYDFKPYIEPKLGMFLGQTMWILKKDGTPMMSNDVWNKGKIPLQFRDRLPDTAYEVSKKTYKKLTTGRMGCRSVGCFDRYHCYRYDYRHEFGQAPYNRVPRDWIVGDEGCPAFINLREIKHFDYIDINDILS